MSSGNSDLFSATKAFGSMNDLIAQSLLVAFQPVLAFGFVTSGFAVAGLLAISIPIAIHLLNRRRYKVVNWAAMQFLLEALRKNRRRLKFEQWLLLCTRCALIGLMGLALARPFGCGDSTMAQWAGRSSALHVVIIDNSYSMAYEADRPGARTHLDQAKKLAGELIGRLSSGNDSVAVIVASAPAQAVIMDPSYDLIAVNAAVQRIEQSFCGTDLPGALTLAEQIGKAHLNQPDRVLHIFSDATTSAWRNGQETVLQSLGQVLSPLYSRIYHYNLSVRDQFNAAVIDLKPAGHLVRTRFANDFRALVRAYGTTVRSTVTWEIENQPIANQTNVTLDAQSPPLTQSTSQLQAGGTAVVSTRIDTQDRLNIDNQRTYAFEIASEMKILLVEGRRGMGPLEGSAAFLDLALAPPASETSDGTRTRSYLHPERISDIELTGKSLSDYRAVMLTDVAQLSPSIADQLATYASQGGTVVWFLGDQVRQEAYNTVLLPRGLIPGPLFQRKSDQTFSFAFNPSGNNHSLLQAFSNIDQSGLETAQIYTYWQVQPEPKLNVEKVLTYRSGPDSSDPAITLHRLGEGMVVFFTTSADPEWTNLPAKPVYVSLIHEIIAGTVSSSEQWMNLLVGQRLELPVNRGWPAVPAIRTDDDREMPLEQVVDATGQTVYRSEPISRPGVYRVVAGSVSWPVCVNLPQDEADIRPLPDQAVASALGGIELITLGAELPSATSVQEVQDFGWSIMGLVLLLLAAECFMAMRFGHYRKSTSAVGAK
jgi:hypothetical protein